MTMLVDPSEIGSLTDTLARLQVISAQEPLGVRWVTVAPQPEIPVVTADPWPGIRLAVASDGSARLAGRDVPESMLRRLHQEALILHQLLSGRVVLHGSAVEIHGSAVVIIGPSGAGKSTTAHALLRTGASLLSDDVVVIDQVGGQLFALPTESRVKLKSEPGGERSQSSSSTADSASSNDSHVADASADPVPLHAVVALTCSDNPSEPQLRRLSGLSALDAVRQYGAGQRGLDVQGPAAFLAGLVRVADRAEVWRVERAVLGPTPQALAQEIVHILASQ